MILLHQKDTQEIWSLKDELSNYVKPKNNPRASMAAQQHKEVNAMEKEKEFLSKVIYTFFIYFLIVFTSNYFIILLFTFRILLYIKNIHQN